MPINICTIKNEYNLGDPNLYNINNNKDDPEGLLEGVAMSGLVGLLRQLGDLAQFAAEIFHDLHEEVMVTAARGHSLTARVQQLESEFPLVERKLLSQTSHTSLLYNSGIDWHPNPRMDQNLVASGDLPRFVMDSYEECRGPPRLFLLDKFDVAGAGACLKRFTDPSFFKAESTSSASRSSGQREKKTRRMKKRGPRWRNGDTPESFPSSHAKLHQLFLEESIETGGCDPRRRVKLKKKQLSGSQFDQDKGKSYMEKILDSYSSEQITGHDACIDPLALTWRSEDDCESGLEMVEKESVETDKSACSSPNIMERVEPYTDGQELANNGESKSEVAVDDGRDSDDGTSEIDKYMDALATIESEAETDSVYNRHTRYSDLRPIVVDSDPSEGKRDLQSFDSHSVGNSITSEDSSNFFRERKSATCSVSMDSLADTTPDFYHQGSNMDIEKMSGDHNSVSEVISGNTPGANASSTCVTGEADGVSSSLLGKISNIPCSTHQSTMIFQENDYLRRGDLDDDYTSRLRDHEHINPTATWSFPETDADARDIADSGHLSREDFLVHVRTDVSDGLRDKLQIELEHTDLDAPSLMCRPVSDTTYAPDDFVSPVVDSSSKEICDDVQTAEEAERAPVINQTENFHPVSDQFPSCALSAAPGSLDTVQTGPSEMQDQCHKPPKQVDADPSEHKLVELSELNPCSEIIIEELPVDNSGDSRSLYAAENIDSDADGPKQVDHDNYYHENFTLVPSSSSVCTHQVQELPHSVIEGFHLNEGELTSCPIGKLLIPKHLDTDLDTPEHSNIDMSNIDENVLLNENDDSVSTSLAKQEVEDHEQLVYPRGFPVLGVGPAEPPINLDAPPLPPLPPMQWRLGRFQNSSDASQRSMKQLNVGFVKPVLATVSEVASQNNVNNLITDGDPSFTTPSTSAISHFGTQDVYVTQEGVHTWPMLGSVSEMTSPDNMNGIRREDGLSFTTPTSAISHFGTQDVYVTQERVHTQPMLTSVSDMTSPNNMNRIGREYDLSFTTPSTSAVSHFGTQDIGVRQERVQTQPMRTSVSEISSPDNMDGIRREDGLLATPESTESQIDQNPDQSLQHAENHHENGSLLEDVSARHVPVMLDVKVGVDADDRDEQHEYIPPIPEQLEENCQDQLPPSVTQPPPGFVAPVPGMMWPGTSDRMMNNVEVNANGTLQRKLPRPRNPLIDEVVAIDKSKLRKVERVKPAPEPKTETGESILEQMQLRKVERVKPPTETKADEVVSLLENLQLRKVGERVKAPIEPNTEERNSLLGQVQLRKVGDGVKPQVGYTTKEREELREQFQLRKVGERTKPVTGDESEGVESLRIQLRKVGERMKSEVGQNEPEETASARVQLRRVGDQVKSEVDLKPEETESPRVQLRKVVERTRPQAVSKTEDRDSLLEQIRNKSFNLKRADVSRPKIQAPNIQGPRTNLKVVAIIEKASNIRQAMAGSDEEDDTDTWE